METSMNSNRVNGTERVVEHFVDMMVKTITELKEGWRKTWITTAPSGRPVNLNGRPYNSLNEFFLYLVCEEKNYKYPVFLTLKQANVEGAHINKGEVSAPVLFWTLYGKDADGRMVPHEKLRRMTSRQIADAHIDVHPCLKYYHVFNIEQTNIAEKAAGKLEKVLKQYQPGEMRGTSGMYENAELDSMIEKQDWLCPIYTKNQDHAFYSPSQDSITIPVKEQFNLGGTEEEVYVDGMEYYSTLLHEMSHSTGTKQRLDRIKTGSPFGSPEYAKEELVAELTAALVGHSLGFNTKVAKNNAAYLDGWLKVLHKEPKFLVSVLADVSKASRMIEEIISGNKMEA